MSKYEPTQQTVWKKLDELSEQGEHNTDARAESRQEFAEGYDSVPVFESPINRRSFMAILSASMAVTAAACRRPDHKLVPSVKSVEYITPGLPNYYSTVYMHKNAANGVLLKVREGRPVKVDGNDMHPVSGGKSGIYTQAALLNLYDPERIRQAVVGRTAGMPKSGGYSTPLNAVNTIAKAISAARDAGKETRILLDEHCSPSLDALCKEIAAANPSIKFVTFPSFLADGAAEANKALFGIDAEFVPNISSAEVIVSVDSDFLGTDKNAVWHTRNFAAGRKPSKEKPGMNKLYAAEANYSLTGSNADERIKLNPSEFEAFLATVHNAVATKKGGSALGGYAAVQAERAKEVAEELVKAGEKACVLVGAHLSPMANGIGMAINAMLGNVGEGKIFAQTLPFSNAKGAGVEELRNDVRSGKVDVILYCDVNPEYTADKDLKNLLTSVANKYSYTYYNDETALNTSINIPSTHQFENWGDAVSFDGTLSIQQPLVAPLNEGSLSLGDMLLTLCKAVNSSMFAEVASYYDYVKARWMNVVGGEEGWTKSLRDGIYAQATNNAIPAANMGALGSLKKADTLSGMAVMVMPGYTLYDGTFSNNYWMLECPDPITKHVWENVALVSKKTAEALGVTEDTKHNEIIRVEANGDGIELPIIIQPGLVDNLVVTVLGYGRGKNLANVKNLGMQIGGGYGENAYRLLGKGSAIGYVSCTAKKVADAPRYRVARSQDYFHYQFEKGREWDPKAPEEKYRDIVKFLTLDEFKKGKEEIAVQEFEGDTSNGSKFKIPISAVSGYEYKGHKWGMVIDLSACTGCNACVVACQSENNISAVGKEQVIRGREMHWIRLDRYYKGDPENPQSVIEPMLCQHCDNAPCENVCPVAATTHSPEGLNEMTYNRCVGTRYCLNNCPYKVRRFNFLDYRENMYREQLGNANPSPLDMVFNPEVSVRMRGVMEKCTFCVQRINEAKYHAKDAGHARVPDGSIVTACESACPASAITFGNTNDKESRVSKLRESERSFLVLDELNVRPAITYLARIRNASEGAA